MTRPCETAADPDLWFPTPGDTTTARTAARICRTCPEMRTCLQGAIDRHEPWGIWGGQLISAGKIIRVRARRAAA